MPNPIHIIKEDHEHVKNLFAMYTGYTEHDIKQKEETAHDILQALTIHMKMEEKFFYPQLASVVESSVTKEAEAEHHAAKMLIMELKMMPVSSDTYEEAGKEMDEYREQEKKIL